MREFLPLKLSFGKTIHTFQGASVGPVSPGQPPNAIKSVICDPGTRTFEGINPGLFYTLLSRVTTLGTDKDRTSSAIFFMGNDMNKARIKNITMTDDGKAYQKVIKRKKWVAFLNANTSKERFDDQTKMGIFCWENEMTSQRRRTGNHNNRGFDLYGATKLITSFVLQHAQLLLEYYDVTLHQE